MENSRRLITVLTFISPLVLQGLPLLSPLGAEDVLLVPIGGGGMFRFVELKEGLDHCHTGYYGSPLGPTKV